MYWLWSIFDSACHYCRLTFFWLNYCIVLFCAFLLLIYSKILNSFSWHSINCNSFCSSTLSCLFFFLLLWTCQQQPSRRFILQHLLYSTEDENGNTVARCFTFTPQEKLSKRWVICADTSNRFTAGYANSAECSRPLFLICLLSLCDKLVSCVKMSVTQIMDNIAPQRNVMNLPHTLCVNSPRLQLFPWMGVTTLLPPSAILPLSPLVQSSEPQDMGQQLSSATCALQKCL